MDSTETGLMREHFPILRDNVYYDVAYKASVPDQVRNAIIGYLDENQSTVGDKFRWAERIDRLRSNIARLIGGRANEIAFVKNASEGINLFAHSLLYRDGDNILISDQEHAANDYPWANLRRFGVEIRRIKSRGYRFGVDDIKPLVDSRTRAISLSLVCQVSGFVPDLAAISEFCRSRGVLVFVDAMQAVGAIRIRVEELGIHGLASSGHKWTLGPYGTGFIYISADLFDEATAVFASKHYTRFDLPSDNTMLIDDAGRWEYGSLNYPGLFGLAAGVEMLLDLGEDKIEAHTTELVERLREMALSVCRLQPILENQARHSGILSFEIGNADGLAAALRDRGIFVSSRKGMIRASQHFYNNVHDIIRFVVSVSELRSSVS